MATKKAQKFTITALTKVEASIDIYAETYSEVIEFAKTLEATDFVKTVDKAGLIDYSHSITCIYPEDGTYPRL